MAEFKVDIKSVVFYAVIGCATIGGLYSFINILKGDKQACAIDLLGDMWDEPTSPYYSPGNPVYSSQDSFIDVEATRDRMSRNIKGNLYGDHAIRARLRGTFPEISDFTIEAIGDSGLYTVTTQVGDFVLSQDGAILINHSYYDLRSVNRSSDVDAIKFVPLVEFTDEYTDENKTQHAADAAAERENSYFPLESDFDWLKSVSIHYPAIGEKVGEIAVFTDVTCPYCRQFHNDYAQLNERGYDVYVALMSRQGGSGSVYELSRAIHCSDNPRALYEQAIAGERLAIRADQDCNAPALDVFNLALDIMPQPQTPGIWLDGRRFLSIQEARRLN